MVLQSHDALRRLDLQTVTDDAVVAQRVVVTRALRVRRYLATTHETSIRLPLIHEVSVDFLAVHVDDQTVLLVEGELVRRHSGHASELLTKVDGAGVGD